MKILIVDDSPSICMFLTHALETESHTVTAVGTGEEGVEHVALSDKPDLIIMDVELPGIDGFEATRQIRKNEGDNWCPIVYLSSHTEEKLIARGIDAGGDSYLSMRAAIATLPNL